MADPKLKFCNQTQVNNFLHIDDGLVHDMVHITQAFYFVLIVHTASLLNLLGHLTYLCDHHRQSL